MLLVLAACPKWSDRKVGDAVGVSHPFVAAVRRGVVTVTTDDAAADAERAAETAAVALDKLTARLTQQLERLLREWPAERRAVLTERLEAVLTEPERA